MKIFKIVILLLSFASYASAQVFLDEDFDAGIPGTWNITDGGTSTDTWIGTSSGYSGSYLDATEFAFVDSDAAGSGVDLDEILESPVVNTTGYTNYYLEFDHYFKTYLGDETAEVDIYDGSVWQTVVTFSDSDVGAWSAPDNQIIDITSYANANLKVRFRYLANFDYYWAIDNVKIVGSNASPCDAITTFPWSENFDGETTPDMPACWAIEDNSAPDDDWMTSTTSSSSSPNCLFISWDSSNPLDDWAFSPGFSLTGGTSYSVEFKYRANSSSYNESIALYYGTSQSSGGMTVELFDNVSFNHTTYETVSVDFTPGSSGTYYFGWHAYSAANLYGIHVDDIVVSLSPTCAAPSNLTAGSITASQAELSWTDNVGTSTFDIELGAAGFTPTETPTQTGVSNNYTYNGLSPDTDYEYYLRADCDGGDYSSWVGPYAFTTACDAITTLPWNENFDGETTPDMPACWTIEDNSAPDDDWKTSSLYASSSPNSMFVSYDYTDPLDDWAFSPGFSLTGGTSYRIEFVYRASSSSYNESLELYYGIGQSSASMSVELFDNSTFNNTTFESVIVDFIPGSSGTYYFGWHANSIANQTGIYVDDIVVSLSPTCAAPSNLTAGSITASQAELSWTDNAGTSTFDIELGAAGFTPTETPTQTGVSNNYTYNGLSPDTDYEYYLRADCGGGDYSSWVGPYAFTTNCAIISTFPHTEDFENAGSIPPCWVQDESNSEDWLFGMFASNSASSDNTSGSGYFAWIDDSSPYDANPSRLLSPVFNTTALSSPVLEFYYWIGAATTGSSLDVDVYDGSTWQNSVATYTSNNGWILASIDLSAYSNAVLQIRFSATENSDYFDCDISVDDFVLKESPTCLTPSNLTAGSITASQAELSWTDNAGTSTFDIELGAAGFTPTETPTQTGVSNNYTYNGLSPDTDYEYYLRADCDGGDYSSWVGPYAFTTALLNGGTNCADPYVINSLPFSQTGMTTNGFGDDYDDLDACGSSYMNGDDIVFEYTPSTNECIDITLSNTDTWTGVFVTDGCPDIGVCVADNTNSAGNPVLSNVQLTASNTYYIVVSTFPSPQFTAFDIDIQSVPCSGSGVDDAWPGLNLGTLTCPGTNVYSDNTTGAFDDCSYILGGDHIYNFTLSDQADVTIQTCGSAFDTKLFVYELVGGDCATANYIAYNDDDCSLQSSIMLNSLPVGDYVVVLEGYLGDEGAYDLTIDLTNCGGDCPNCSNGVRDCQETGVDCGGPDCPPCSGWEHPTVGLQGTYNGGCMVPTCGGNYYDDGGSAGNYSNDVDLIYRTFCPEQPNKCLKATFNSLDIDDVSIDDLRVLNGPTQNSDILWWGYGNMDDLSFVTLDGNWNGGEIISTHDSGCLTFRFYSDDTGQAEGWEIAFDCVDCSGPSGLEANDCENSIAVCNNFDFTGASTGPGLSNDGCSGCVTSETYSNWYQIEVMSSGTLGLTIDPITNSDDYDFALYQSYDCNNLGSPVRCSFAANYSAHCFNGIMDEDETGVDTGGADCPAVASDGNTGMVDGAGDLSEDVTGDMWVEDISVTEGETYFLLINNWSPDGDGFDLTWDLSNGASLGVQPKIESAINANINTFEVEISEPIKCSSVSSDGSDFTLECAGSTTEAECLANSIVAANPMNCVNDSTSWIEITLANAIPQAKASYENDWKIRCSGTNAVVDICNNPLNGGDPEILLPVEFLFLNGICHNAFVEILWTTASEMNNEYFTLQRSDDGQQFIDLTTVLGAGNSSIATDYSWIDDDPLNETAYYRIKQTDFDGKSTFSEVFPVFCQTEIGNLNISPNPCGDYMDIEFSSPTAQEYRLEIYSTLGNPILSFQIPEDTQNFKLTGLDKLTPGMYILEIVNGNSNRFYRFVKM